MRGLLTHWQDRRANARAISDRCAEVDAQLYRRLDVEDGVREIRVGSAVRVTFDDTLAPNVVRLDGASVAL